MDRKAGIDTEAYIKNMREMSETMLREVAGAVNKAPNGAWIKGSEMQVRDLVEDYQRRAYELALQMRADAAQAARPPGGRGDTQAPAKQGP